MWCVRGVPDEGKVAGTERRADHSTYACKQRSETAQTSTAAPEESGQVGCIRQAVIGMGKKKNRGEGRLADKPQTSEQKLPGQARLPFGKKKKVICLHESAPKEAIPAEEAREFRDKDCHGKGRTCCSLLES